MLGITDDRWYKGIADKIRTYMPSFKKSEPSGFPQAVENLFIYGTQMGQEAGYQTGYDLGLEVGKQVEREAFWDSFQNDELPDNGDYRFAGAGWNNNTFKPTKSMKPTSATGMFRRNRFNGDMVALFEQQEITLDFSECTVMTYAFYECSAERLGVIDCTMATSLTGTFGYMYNCHTIDLIKVHSGNTFASSFRCPALVEVRFEGVIAQNGVDFHWSTNLSATSISSIINALSTATTGLTVTLSLAAVNKAFETSSGANDGSTSAAWQALESTRTNWTIALE